MRDSNPNFLVAADAELFGLRWRETTIESFDRLTAHIVAQRERAGRPLVYVAILGIGSASVDEETRARMMAAMSETYPHMQMCRVALIAPGLRATMIRAGLVAMTLVAGFRGEPFHVDKTAEDMAKAVAEATGRDAKAVLDWFVGQGLIEPNELAGLG